MAYAYPGNAEDPDGHQADCGSLTQMSDEVKEMYCEDCDKDFGTSVTADGFCVNCLEYLCPTCIRYHKKHLPQHTLQDSSNMPQDFCFDKCTNHPKEILKFYCNTCETTACPKCKTEKHDNCSEVCHIPTLVNSDKMTDDIRQLSLSIDETLEELAAKKDRVTSNLTEINSSKEEAIAAIKMHQANLKSEVKDQYKHLLDDLGRKQTDETKALEQKRAEVIAKLDKEKAELLERHNRDKSKLEFRRFKIFKNIDKSEQDLENESEQKNQTDVHKLLLILSGTDNAEAEVNEMKTSIDRKKKTGEKCELFIAMKYVMSDIEKIKTDMQKTMKFPEKQNFVFQVKEDKVDLKSTECEVRFGCLRNKFEVKRTLTYAGSMEISCSSNEWCKRITGLCKVSDQLVVVDQSKASINLIDLKQDIQTSSIQLENKPFDVTCVDTDHVATTLPEAGKIQFLCLTQTGEMSLSHEIAVGKRCYGIEYFKPNLLVTCQDPGCVKILSKQGDPIKTITGFHTPRYITVKHNSEIFYVEDTKYLGGPEYVKTVKKSNSDGKIITVSERFACRQSGLAVDQFGSVYISGTNQESDHYSRLLNWFRRRYCPLIQLSANLETVQRTDIEKREYFGRVSCLFYCNKQNKLYAGTEMGKILIFKVT